MLVRCPVSRAATRMPVVSRASTIALPFRRPCRRYREARRIITMAENEDAVSTYATALASVADSDEKLKEIHFDMDRLATIIKNSADVQDFLTNPSVNEDKQKEVLGTICRDAGFVQQTQNFLNLVVDKGRAGLLEDICRTFEEQYCQMTSTQVAVLTSAYPMDEDAQYEIAKQLQKLSGAKNIKLKPVLDPSLIGGFVVEFDSNQIDMSVKGQITQIATNLIGNSVPA